MIMQCYDIFLNIKVRGLFDRNQSTTDLGTEQQRVIGQSTTRGEELRWFQVSCAHEPAEAK